MKIRANRLAVRPLFRNSDFLRPILASRFSSFSKKNREKSLAVRKKMRTFAARKVKSTVVEQMTL